MSPGGVRTCFVYCFNAFTCACLSAKFFRPHRGARGCGGARAEWNHPLAWSHSWIVDATYCQSSVPQQHSFNVLRGYADAWCESGVEKTRAAHGSDVCVPAVPALRKSFRGLQCTQHRTGAHIWASALPASTPESPFPCHTACSRTWCVPPPAVWLHLSSRQISLCASAAQDITSCLAPRVMTP